MSETRSNWHDMPPPNQESLRRIDQKTDEDLARDVADDPDAAPLLDSDWWKDAELVDTRPKVPISLRIDPDVLEFFKEKGPGYQTRINAVLRRFMDATRAAGDTADEGNERKRAGNE